MIKNRDQIDQAGREFYWKRNPNERPIIAESTRPDILIGYREGYEQALRDIKAALEPQESISSPMKNKSVWQTIKEREEGKVTRKFKLEDSFKATLESAVVGDVPVSSWMDQHRGDYDKLLKSGMFWEFHPTWTGEWERDKYAFCHDKRFKKK